MNTKPDPTIPFPPKPKRGIEFLNSANAEPFSREFLSFVNEMPALPRIGDAAAPTWTLISPYGDFKNEIPDPANPGKKKTVIQRFDQIAAAEMVQHANSTIGQLKMFLKGIPMYLGHPDSGDAEVAARYTDKRAYGRYKMIEARNDGLWGALRASTAGKQMINDEEVLFPSPRWFSSEKPIAIENGVEIYRPVWLASVGLTDNPNIQTAAPLPHINERPNPTQPQETSVNKELLLFVAGLLGFENEAKGAADEFPAALTEKVKTGLQTLKTDAGKAATLTTELQNEKTEHGKSKDALVKAGKDIDAAKTEFNNERKARIEDLLNGKLREGVLTADSQAAWRRRLEKDFGNESAELGKLKPTVKTRSVTDGRATDTNLPSDSQAKLTEYINEEYAKLPAATPHGTRWDKAFENAKKTHPREFGTADAETSE